MKQLLAKLVQPFTKGGKAGGKSSVPRVTNDTLAENREEVLQKGKRYKYPVQQTKKRTVLISSIIVALLLVGTSAFTYWQLYIRQSTSSFMYQVTQILPLPVGEVAGETVMYRDYLRYLRSSIHYLTTQESVNLQSDNGRRRLAYKKRQNINRVLKQALVRKIAAQRDIRVSEQAVTQFVQRRFKHNDIGATKEDFKDVIREYYGWSFEQYRQSVREQLLKKKVSSAIADQTRQTAEKILRKLAKKGGASFAELAKQYSDEKNTAGNGGDVGFVSLDEPGPKRLVRKAATLKEGEVSNVIERVNGFYIIKTLEKRDHKVRYARIFLRYTAFQERFQRLREQGKVHVYIDIPKLSEITRQPS